MFDGLKEKLGRFRDDVEESAEEKADEAAVEESGDGEAEAAEATKEESESADAAEPVDAESGVESGEGGVEQVEEPVESDDADEAATDEAIDDADGESDDGDEPADDGDEATDDVNESAGEDAEGDAGFGRKLKSAARGKVVIEEEDLEDPLWDLEMALLESDVEMGVAEEILDGIRDELVGETKSFRESTGGVVADALRDALLSVISVGQFDFEERVAEAEKPLVIIFTGVNGVGKTTTIAKMATYLEDQGYSTVLANGDTYRAGANEQLQEHADNLGLKLISHEQGSDPAAVIYDGVEYAKANDVDVVLGDTAGRLHTSNDLMAQLEKIGRVVDPDMTIFVDEAVAGQDAVNRAREFDDAVAVDGTILTKADADSQGGAAISVAHVTGKPILFLGTGQGYDDLRRFDPEQLVEDLVGEE